ncbi:MAG: cytochrome P450 [Acidimicrobiia bacterium]|nr:cytochrome P450 [Acidimicrobiia bacterium]
MVTTKLPHPPWREQPQLLRRGFVDPSMMLDELSARYGPIFGLGTGPFRLAVVGDPTALREMFSMPVDSFRWGYRFNVLRFVVGDQSMIVSDGEPHKRRRASVKSAFGRRSLNGWIPMIVGQTDVVVDELAMMTDADRSPIDLYRVGRRLVLYIVVRTLFGERFAGRAAEISELYQRPQDYIEAPLTRQLPHPFPWTARARVRADRHALDGLIDEQIAFLRANPSDDPRDVLARLVTDGDLSDSEIRDQVVTLIGAGFDTTSASLAWMIWRVSLTPGLWGRLRDEADDVFGPIEQHTTPDERSLAGLTLANATMRETTRLHPAGVVSPREAASDIELGGHHIPKGTLILWSAHLAGRDSGAWDEPLKFQPDRFSHLTGPQQQLANSAWIPFGRGQRNCLGLALAQMELTLIISRLAQRLDISTSATGIPRPAGMVINRPAGGAPMNVSIRPTRRRSGPDLNLQST